MGSESTPPNPTDDNPQQNQEPVKSMSGSGTVLAEESTEEIPQKPVFVNSEPMREEQVQNAMKFLSHPKVRGSPIMHRRSFLERKGLTKEEIDEAFRRVPDPAPSATTTQPANPNQVGQEMVPTNSQLQAPTQAPQAAPTNVASTVTTLHKPVFRWSHAFIAIGLLAASGVGTALLLKNAVIPKLKSWIRKVVLEEEVDDDSLKKNNSRPSFAEEAAAATKAAAAAAADVAKASQEMLNSKNEDRRYIEALVKALNVQVEEMKLMGNVIRKLEVSVPSIKQTQEVKSTPQHVRQLSPPPSTEPSAAPHPKSYTEIMAMVQRGEKPPGINEINDLPPDPNQPPSKSLVARRGKPWEMYGNNASSKAQEAVPTSQLNGDNPVPWWRQKNPSIAEMEAEDEWRPDPPNAKAVQRTWVPPQPPPIAMPEAAAAIRRPKPSIQKEQSGGDQETRVAQISESGGEEEITEVNGDSEVHEIEVQ